MTGRLGGRAGQRPLLVRSGHDNRPAWSARRGPVRAVQFALVLLTMLMAMVATGLLAQPAIAQEDEAGGPGLRGSLLYENEEGERVGAEGVIITVTGPDGAEAGSATTDAEGAWLVELDGPGEYTATVDPETLPEGVSLANPEQGSVTREVEDEAEFAIFNIVSGAEVAGQSGLARRAIQLFVEGINLGLLIAMMAIGLSLIYGTTGLVNFAHGEAVTLGAFLAWVFNISLGMHLVWAALLSIVVSAGVGALLDRGIFRPLRQRGIGLISQLVITIGLSMFLRYGILYIFTGSRRVYGQYATQQGDPYGPILLPPKTIFSFVISVIVLVGIGLLLERTQMGRAMRAVSDNRDLAESSGINVQKVILFVWAVGGALAALGGILWGVSESIRWIMGFRLLLPIFAGVILGGIGTAYGALVGSLVVGIFIQMSTLVIPTELKEAAAMLILAVILVVRPQGIMGRSERVG